MTKLLLIAAFVVGVVSANPFRSPNGVKVVNVYPLVKEPTTPPLLACDLSSNQIPSSEVLENPTLRAHSGLYEYSTTLRNVYSEQQSRLKPELRYRDSRSGGSMSVASVEAPGECETRKMSLSSDSAFGEAFCQCGSSKSPEAFCQTISGYVNRTMCASQYEFDSNTCSSLNAALDSFDEVSSKCTVLLAGNSSSLDLSMNNLLFPYGNLLPETLNLTESAAMLQEGRTMYLAWMASDRFGRFADASRYCDRKDVDLLPGWDNLMYLYAGEEGEDKSVPLLSLSVRGHENFMIVVRDFKTTFEGRLTVQNNLGFKYLVGQEGAIHEGFASVLAAVTSPLDIFFDNFFQVNYNQTDISYSTTLIHPRILVVGQGAFGGGVAAALAEYLASKWDNDDLPWSPMLSVDSILFGAPRVGGAEFVSSYNSKVNGRNLISKYDGTVMPCRQQALCNSAGTEVVTGTAGTVESYATIGGSVLIDPETNSEFIEADGGWASETARLELVGQHVCAPKCYLVRTFCDDDPFDMCTSLTCSRLFH